MRKLRLVGDSAHQRLATGSLSTDVHLDRDPHFAQSPPPVSSLHIV